MGKKRCGPSARHDVPRTKASIMRVLTAITRKPMVGSGLAEATNKAPITSRMKGSGMIWVHSGGQAILTRRSSMEHPVQLLAKGQPAQEQSN